MKILCTCAEGNNRAVTFAHILKYVKGFETMTLGLETNSHETKELMFEWADVIIIPEQRLMINIPPFYRDKVRLYDVGPDAYPRPFNQQLYRRIKALLDVDRIA